MIEKHLMDLNIDKKDYDQGAEWTAYCLCINVLLS